MLAVLLQFRLQVFTLGDVVGDVQDLHYLSPFIHEGHAYGVGGQMRAVLPDKSQVVIGHQLAREQPLDTLGGGSVVIGVDHPQLLHVHTQEFLPAVTQEVTYNLVDVDQGEITIVDEHGITGMVE